MQPVLGPDSFDEMRGVVEDHLSFVPTDDQLSAAIVVDTNLVGLAQDNGWGDPALREPLVAALEKIQIDQAREPQQETA